MSKYNLRHRVSHLPLPQAAVFVVALTLLAPLAAQALSISDLTGAQAGAVDLRLSSIAKLNFPGGFSATPSSALSGGNYSYTFSWSRAYPNRNGYIYVSQKQSDGQYHIVASFTNLTGKGTVTSDPVFAPSTAYRISYYSKPYGSHTTDYVILRSIWTTPGASGDSSSSSNAGTATATACPDGFQAIPTEQEHRNMIISDHFTNEGNMLAAQAPRMSNAFIQNVYGPNIIACTLKISPAFMTDPSCASVWDYAVHTDLGNRYAEDCGGIIQADPKTLTNDETAIVDKFFNPVCPSGWKRGAPVLGLISNPSTYNPSKPYDPSSAFSGYCVPESAKTLAEQDPANNPIACPAGWATIPSSGSLFTTFKQSLYGPNVLGCYQPGPNNTLAQQNCPAGFKLDAGNAMSNGIAAHYCVPKGAVTLGSLLNVTYKNGPPQYCTGFKSPYPVTSGDEFDAIYRVYGNPLVPFNPMDPSLQVCNNGYPYEQCPAGWKWPTGVNWPASDSFTTYVQYTPILEPGQSATGPMYKPGPAGQVPTAAALSILNSNSSQNVVVVNGDYLSLCIPSAAAAH